jgi:EpsI family protein
VTPEVASWEPRYVTPDARYDAAFRGPAGQTVGVKILYYRNQGEDKALISSVNRLTAPKEAWHETAASRRVEKIGAREFAVRETLLDGPEGRLLVWHWLWVGGQDTTSNYAGKLLQARAKMLFAGDDGAAVMLTAPWQDKPEQARQALRAFMGENLGAIDTALVNAREH